jgi:hypothetical protein
MNNLEKKLEITLKAKFLKFQIDTKHDLLNRRNESYGELLLAPKKLKGNFRI